MVRLVNDCLGSRTSSLELKWYKNITLHEIYQLTTSFNSAYNKLQKASINQLTTSFNSAEERITNCLFGQSMSCVWFVWPTIVLGHGLRLWNLNGIKTLRYTKYISLQQASTQLTTSFKKLQLISLQQASIQLKTSFNKLNLISLKQA